MSVRATRATVKAYYSRPTKECGMNTKSKRHLVVAALIASMALSACGGSTQGTGEPEPVEPPPLNGSLDVEPPSTDDLPPLPPPPAPTPEG